MSQELNEEQKEILMEFINESQESLEKGELLLIDLEQSQDPQEQSEIIGTVFRIFHSLKGGAGFLNLLNIQKVTHAAENLLQYFRESPKSVTPDTLELLGQARDLISHLVVQTEEKFHDKGLETETQEIANLLAFAEKQLSSPGQSIVLNQKSPPPNKTGSTIFFLQKDIAPEILKSFIEDCEEHLDQIEEILLNLEKLETSEDTTEYLQTIYRDFHTIKGNSGLIKLTPLENFTHKLESAVDEMIKKTIPTDKKNIQILLSTVDILRLVLAKIDKSHFLEEETLKMAQSELNGMLAAKNQSSHYLGDILVDMGATTSDTIETALGNQAAPLGEILVGMDAIQPNSLTNALEKQKEIKTKTPSVSRSRHQDIRVNLNKIDQMIDLVGELVISEAMVVNNPDLETLQLPNFKKAARQHNKNIRELQEIAMSMRMMPVSTSFRKMIRLVHDVSKKVGKDVNLELAGEDTEIDKTVIEAIADPLVHILRNAIDHGLEIPKVRRKVGKPEKGNIRLEAKHSGSEVLIIIEDDGQGLNRQKIIERAQSKGLVDSQMKLSDEEVWKLIFEPGFSTSEEVSDLSGRGVGMDVVKRNIEKLRGWIDIQSTAGKGTTFVLHIPLTLSIVEGMLLRVGDLRYTVSLEAIRESLLPKVENLIKTMDGQETIKIRDDLLPVIRLGQLHNLNHNTLNLSEGKLVVVEANNRQFCLFVDEVIGRQQIVVKSVPKYVTEMALKSIDHISGCTILGDGSISLILDIGSLIHFIETPV